MIRRCVLGEYLHNQILDYTWQFWEAYPDVKKYFRAYFQEAHEATGEVVTTIDQDIANFLEKFHSKGYLSDTIITFLADHGAHFAVMHAPFLPDDSRMRELHLPLLIHLTKTDIPEENLNYLRLNQQAFVSSHDYYSTLKSIAEGK
jgi:membrane-anchored protein YejM (alkaline phosphatase superfamily)